MGARGGENLGGQDAGLENAGSGAPQQKLVSQLGVVIHCGMP
jgi:hypothetical protein